MDHHEGYVSWAEYERIQRVIADNAARYGRLTRGAVRRGEGLLAGLLRCGHCGRRVHVAYSGTKGKCVRYSCRSARLNHGTKNRCIPFGGMRVDAAVTTEVLRLLRPLGIEAALKAVAMCEQEHADRRHHADLALTQARYEADLAGRQYDAVDPANRLVAAELERRWNDRLVDVPGLWTPGRRRAGSEGWRGGRPQAPGSLPGDRWRPCLRWGRETPTLPQRIVILAMINPEDESVSSQPEYTVAKPSNCPNNRDHVTALQRAGSRSRDESRNLHGTASEQRGTGGGSGSWQSPQIPLWNGSCAYGYRPPVLDRERHQ